MKQLSTMELLGIWQTYMHYPPIERSLHLLSALYDSDISMVAKISIGDRDASLLKFREWIFGSRLINMADCPKCDEQVEWETDIADLRVQEAHPEMPIKILKLDSDGFKIDFRLPNSYDIMHAISNPVLINDIQKFISGCIINIQKDQKEYSKDSLPLDIIEYISEEMSAADPQADIKMILTCPACKNKWEAPFDILHYLWLEIDSWAKRVLKEVAVLARAFSWSEKEILSLSPQRRQMYLDIVSA